MPCAGRRTRRAGRPRRPRRNRRRRQGAASPMRRISRRRRRRTSRRRALSLMPGGYSHVLVAGDRLRQERDAAHRGASSTSRRSRTSPASKSADTFVRPIYAGNAFATVQSKDPIKVLTVRTTAFDARPTGGNAAIESDRRGARHGAVEGHGPGAHEVRAAGAHQRAHRDLGRTRPGQRRELQAAGSARRQAQRGARRVARGGRRGLRAERLPGGADRQDRRARSLHRDRHLRRDPAPRRA